MELLVERLPVHNVRHPGEAVHGVEDGEGELPGHVEGVDEEQVPGKGNSSIIHAVRILEVNGGVLDIVTAIQQQLSLSVELECLGWLVNLVCSF